MAFRYEVAANSASFSWMSAYAWGCHGEVAEVIDELADVASALTVGRDLAHGEISAAEGNTLGVDADEDLRDCLYVEVVVERDDADLGVLDGFEPGDVRLDGHLVNLEVGLEVCFHEPVGRSRIKELANVRDPFRLLCDDRG